MGGRRRPSTVTVLGLTPYSAPEGIRTPNLLIRSQMLYPLSYERLGAESRGSPPGLSPVGGHRADLDGAAEAGGGDAGGHREEAGPLPFRIRAGHMTGR